MSHKYQFLTSIALVETSRLAIACPDGSNREKLADYREHNLLYSSYLNCLSYFLGHAEMFNKIDFLLALYTHVKNIIRLILWSESETKYFIYDFLVIFFCIFSCFLSSLWQTEELMRERYCLV